MVELFLHVIYENDQTLVYWNMLKPIREFSYTNSGAVVLENSSLKLIYLVIGVNQHSRYH